MKWKRLYNITKLIVIALFGSAAILAIHHQYDQQHKETVPVIPYQDIWVENIETVKIEQISDDTYGSRTYSEIPYTSEEEIAQELEADELEEFATCVEAEAGGESFLGKCMVADVIINRVRSKDFPNTFAEVIEEPYRFSSYWDGAMERAIPSEETYRACQQELKKQMYPEIYYFTAEGYSEYGTPWKKVGNHYFSKK